MPLVRTRTTPDGERITAVRPDGQGLSDAERDRFTEVADGELDEPAHENWEQAHCYLESDGTVTWVVTDRPAGDPAMMAKRLSDLADRVAALESHHA